MKKFLVSLSILSANFTEIDRIISNINKTDIDYIHIDIMDGNFVNNISFGFDITHQISEKTNKKLDVHLMVNNPENYIEQFAKIKSVEFITFHIETTKYPIKIINKIKSFNIKAGIAINPSTHPLEIEYIINELDLILLMSVEPGFGMQKFIHQTLEKSLLIKKQIEKENKKDIIISIDGGINSETAKICKNFPIDMLACGSYIIKSDNFQEKINLIR